MVARFVKEKGITGDFLLNLLINKKIIGSKEIDDICQKQINNKTSIERIILSSGIINKKEMMKLLSEEIGVPYVELEGKSFDPTVVATLSEEISRKHNIVTIGKNKGKLVVAMANPLDVYIHDEIRITTGFEVEPYLAFKDDINKALDSVYGITENWQNMIGDIAALPVTAVEEEAEEMEITKGISESHETPVIAWSILLCSELSRRERATYMWNLPVIRTSRLGIVLTVYCMISCHLPEVCIWQ